MNELPRQKLCEIITRYGLDVYDNPQRCEGLLRDFCGQYRKEIAVLVGALKDGVPGQLQTSKNSVPYTILLAQLSKRLQDNLGFAEEAATWVVESWALALGVISEKEIQSNKNSVNVNTVTQPTQNQTLPQPQVTPSVTPTNQQPSVKPPTQPPVTYTKLPATQPPSTKGNKKAIAISVVGFFVLLGGLAYFQGQERKAQEIAESKAREEQYLEAEQSQRKEAQNQLAEEKRKRQEVQNQLAEEKRKRQEAQNQLAEEHQKEKSTATNSAAFDTTSVFNCRTKALFVKVSIVNNRTLRYSVYDTSTQLLTFELNDGIEGNQNGEKVYKFSNGSYLYAVYQNLGNDRIEVYEDNQLINKLYCQ